MISRLSQKTIILLMVLSIVGFGSLLTLVDLKNCDNTGLDSNKDDRTLASSHAISLMAGYYNAGVCQKELLEYNKDQFISKKEYHAFLDCVSVAYEDYLRKNVKSEVRRGYD